MHGSRADYYQWRGNTLADKFAQEQQKVIALDIFHGVTVWVDGFVSDSNNHRSFSEVIHYAALTDTVIQVRFSSKT